jgi:hydrogenase expression/formation protein HypE
MSQPYPVGKLPAELLSQLLSQAPVRDERVLLGPGIGLDCAVIDIGPNLLVLKSDPITFATDKIGWYAVQVNCNDIATTGAIPRWMLFTLLLPDHDTDEGLVREIFDQVYQACENLEISVVGGHTEVTNDLDRPIIVGTMIGEVPHHKLITPQGAKPTDRILLTKGVPIEATAILAREYPERLGEILTKEELRRAADYLYDPGISVFEEARIVAEAGRITAMHDPTEGGLATALWELAQASGRALVINPRAIHIPDLAAKICDYFSLNPLASIASGALLMTVDVMDANQVQATLASRGIQCTEIGFVETGMAGVWVETDGIRRVLPQAERDEITRLFEST